MISDQSVSCDIMYILQLVLYKKYGRYLKKRWSAAENPVLFHEFSGDQASM